MQMGDFCDPVLQRAKIVSQLYFDLVYFRDRVLILLHETLSKINGASDSFPYLHEWLRLLVDVRQCQYAIRLRRLRNGFAHGKWEYLSDYSGIACYPDREPPGDRYEFTQDEISIAHSLIYAFQIVFFSVVVDGV